MAVHSLKALTDCSMGYGSLISGYHVTQLGLSRDLPRIPGQSQMPTHSSNRLELVWLNL